LWRSIAILHPWYRRLSIFLIKPNATLWCCVFAELNVLFCVKKNFVITVQDPDIRDKVVQFVSGRGGGGKGNNQIIKNMPARNRNIEFPFFDKFALLPFSSFELTRALVTDCARIHCDSNEQRSESIGEGFPYTLVANSVRLQRGTHAR
jgi:hypothetical protein